MEAIQIAERFAQCVWHVRRNEWALAGLALGQAQALIGELAGAPNAQDRALRMNGALFALLSHHDRPL